ncbi:MULTISPECIES: asparaginase [Halomonadaceae]|uniref:asparaginase n=1 Tax=Halomonadaceae TaxID=28256 RepID=UPI001C630CCD|nr:MULTISPECIES: asparaginase [Halomonas]MCG7591200.1 asparaginase [Halomonas sp. McD50-5]MCG7617432.1 asparaginase [Halomonas sp. McD50-4]
MSQAPLLADTPHRQERVLVIYTGGTIGMQPQANGLSPAGHFSERLDKALSQRSLQDQSLLPAYDVMSYSPLIDSSAATPLTWQQLASDIAERFDQYRGFVVIHGTDTLSWTAASLAYQLQGLDRPVVLTGAMAPLETPNGDGLGNVYGALRFSAHPQLQEVAVYFADRLLRGVRAIKQHSEASDAFTSPSYPPLGERVGDDFILFPSRGLVYQQRGAPRFERLDYQPVARGEVVRIALWPGMAAWQLDAWLGHPNVKGALLQLWGAGNLPDDPDLLAVIAKASSEGKLIAAISQCPQGRVKMGAYAAGNGLVDAGVLSGDDMTPEAVYTKLVHLIAQPLSPEDRRERFMMPLVGER